MLPLEGNIANFHDGKLYEIHPELHVMQFTGLQDKNGKEIYEGDIVSCIWDGHSYEDIGPAKVAVSADERGLAYGYFPFVVPPSTRGKYEGYFEVVGNIYENPDLLS